jgi:ABC-type Mn2+/Zn2+ transport system permease subunit
MHMALLGAACSLALNQQPVVGAVVAIVVGSLLLGPLSDRMKMDAGLTSALFMTGSIAAAFILFYRARVPAMEAFGLFTGSILAMTETETWVILIVGTVVLAVFVALYREIQLVLYDRELAKLLGVPAEAVRNGLLVLTGLAIGLAMRIVGALLVDAVMLLPALGAMMIGKSLAQVLVVCSVLGILSASGGLLLSMAVDLPSGASMTVVAVMALMVVATIKSILVQRRGVRDE